MPTRSSVLTSGTASAFPSLLPFLWSCTSGECAKTAAFQVLHRSSSTPRLRRRGSSRGKSHGLETTLGNHLRAGQRAHHRAYPAARVLYLSGLAASEGE